MSIDQPNFNLDKPKDDRNTLLKRFGFLSARSIDSLTDDEFDELESLTDKLGGHEEAQKGLMELNKAEGSLTKEETARKEEEDRKEEEARSKRREEDARREDFESASNFIGLDILPPSLYLHREITNTEFERRFPKRFKIYKTLMGFKMNQLPLPEDVREGAVKTLRGLNRIDFFIDYYKGLKHSRREDAKIDPEIAKIAEAVGLAEGGKKERKLEYREGQVEVFEAFRDFFEGRITSDKGDIVSATDMGYFDLPTAFGKTITFVKFIEAFGMKALIVTPRTNLVDQINKSFEEFAPQVSTTRVDKKSKSTKGQAVATTYLSFVSKTRDDAKPSERINPQDFDVVIFDEAHHLLGSEDRLRAFDKFKHAKRIGFTATPEYFEGKSLADVFDGQKIFGMTINEAITKGLLSSCRTYPIRTKIDLKNVERKTGAGGEVDYNSTQLSEVINSEPFNKRVVEHYRENFLGQSLLVFCADIDHARTVAETFNKEGIVAAAYVSEGMSDIERAEIVEKYKKGEIKALCGVVSIKEGFDAPVASVCFNLAPTLSRVNAKQRMGRVLRLFKYKDENGVEKDKFATVVDFLYRDTSKNRGLSPILAYEIKE